METVVQLSRMFNAAPFSGGVLDWPIVPLFRMLAVLEAGGGMSESGGGTAEEVHPLAAMTETL